MKKELWQPNPDPVTVIEVDVDTLIDLTELLRERLRTYVTHSSSYQRGEGYQRSREIVVDWHVPYGEDFSAIAGEYIVIDSQDKVKVFSKEQLNSEFVHVSNPVTLDAEDGTCRACGQPMLRYQGDIWHRYSGRTCPAELRGISKDELFVPKKKD